MSTVSESYFSIKKNIHENVNLIAVSKTKPADLIKEVYNLGQRDFGENKVQELLEKSEVLAELDQINWHFIGHLQSNKINQLLSVHNLKFIHSIDRMDLLDKLLSKTPKNKIGLFIQVNTSFEDEKGGFTELNQINLAISKINSHDLFYFVGLMTIGKIRTDDFEKDARACFLRLNQLKQLIEDELKLKVELSMGMSSDYLIAQQMGSNWLRVGSSIFGNRS